MTTTLITGIIQEEWRSINGYLNFQVSSLGRVRNIKTARIFKSYIDNAGYIQVALYEDKKQTSLKVHRLVAQEFLDNPGNKATVDHIDHDKTNNCINNLRWATISENNMNKRKTKSQTSSSYKGVYFHKASKKWQASVCLNGKKNVCWNL